jgi:hypothetical protein
MAGYSNTARNVMLAELASVGVYASLHTSDPGDSGTGEVSGGSPAYARKSITWGTAGTPTTGEVAATSQPIFDVPAGTTVTYVGVWSASSGGTFYGSGEVPAETFGSQGTYTLTTLIMDLLS